MADRNVNEILGINEDATNGTPFQKDNLETDLDTLHCDILKQIKEKFPDFETVAFYRDDEEESLPTPSCLLSLDEFEPSGIDPGTGQISLLLRFSARLIFSREHKASASFEVRTAAIYLANLINKNRFSGHISPAIIVHAGPDMFRTDIEGRYEIWRIEWVHKEAIFGNNIYYTSPEKIAPVLKVYSHNDLLIYQRESSHA